MRQATGRYLAAASPEGAPVAAYHEAPDLRG